MTGIRHLPEVRQRSGDRRTAAVRGYDEADRDRDRATLLVTITPSSLFDLSVSYANGRENFDLELMRARPRTDMRFSFDMMDSSNEFLFGGPRINQLNTNTFVAGSAPCTAGLLRAAARCRDQVDAIERRYPVLLRRQDRRRIRPAL